AFDELLKIQVENNLKKISWQKYSQSLPIKLDRGKLQEFIKNLPFNLTPSQLRSIGEISDDLEKVHPMNRLLEGDVGSGKTVVAAAGAYLAFLNGYQSIVMAPTQILASQHFATFKSLLSKHKVEVSLITAATVKKKQGNADVLIGTHALIESTANFRKVAFVVIDEQHRFGVKQRGKLAKKAISGGSAPNILTMTATPIPRTIALTLYGDLDLSTLDEIPTTRPKVTTWIVPESKRQKAYRWLSDLIKKNSSQAFVVCPLIEESESMPLKEVKAVKLEINKLKILLPKLKIGLLHGQMKAKEKDKVLDDFKNKKYDILVTTPVVEVGIDIPNAVVMVIETAERYGLAQLHQLRGRVGRGEKKSYCLLFTTNSGSKVKERLTALTKSHSGRELAELDLKIRGVGEIFGTRQHGVGELKIASWQDIDLIKKSRKLALEIVNNQDKYVSIIDYFKSKQIADN
ncbi:ATP-dependent DNA helicase RecG, partial [Candidatus Woesebacteria bacterium]|nr:ATP-dependent DNA helicase RecG [Candidatus Woesebacteria bacterium]